MLPCISIRVCPSVGPSVDLLAVSPLLKARKIDIFSLMIDTGIPVTGCILSLANASSHLSVRLSVFRSCYCEKDGLGPLMVSNTLCPAVHILGT